MFLITNKQMYVVHVDRVYLFSPWFHGSVRADNNCQLVDYFALGHQPQDDVCSGASTIPGMVSLVESCLVDSFLSFAS